jgi:hypothetical protein
MHSISDVTAAEMCGISPISLSKMEELQEMVFKNPHSVMGLLAVTKGGQGRVLRRRPTREEKEEKAAAEAAKGAADEKAAAAMEEDDEDGISTCDFKHMNGKMCGKKIRVGAVGLNNHRRTHTSKPKRGTPKGSNALPASAKKAKLKVTHGVLKLTTRMAAYKYMTAAVGERGGKRMEVKQDSKWIRSRCDGRTYDSVQIYGSNIFDEKGHWSLFECEGYEESGAEGETYDISFGDGVGTGATIEGKVWLIHLGKVIQRHTPTDAGSAAQ